MQMKKKSSLGLALFLLGLSIAFKIEIDESVQNITWIWTNRIQIPIILAGGALLALGHYFYIHITEQNEKF